jgi:hypothetical protein
VNGRMVRGHIRHCCGTALALSWAKMMRITAAAMPRRPFRTEDRNPCSTADQRTAAPVFGDAAEQPMLDRVPFADPGQKMTGLNDQIQFISQFL